MDIRQIQYFLRVYEERSFSRAAERSNVVQPALSMQIRRLEEELGTTLFSRTPKGIEPTATGHRLYELCVPILRSLAEARQEIIDAAAGRRVSGTLHVGSPPSVNRGIFGNVLSRYAERYPDVEVTVTEAYSNALTAMVQAGVIDLALGARPGENTSIEGRKVLEDRLLLVSGSPLKGPTLTPCRLADLADLNLVLPSQHNLLGTTILGHMKSGNISPGRIMKVDGVVATLELARRPHWASIFPMIAMTREIEEGGFHLYPIVDPIMTFDLYFVTDHRRPPSLAARVFIEIVEEELAAVSRLRERLFSETSHHSS